MGTTDPGLPGTHAATGPFTQHIFKDPRPAFSPAGSRRAGRFRLGPTPPAKGIPKPDGACSLSTVATPLDAWAALVCSFFVLER